MAFTKIAAVPDVAPGSAKQVAVNGRMLAVFNVGGTFYVLDDTCTHRGGPLVEGEVSGHEVTCPYHGAKFDIRTGEVLGPPAQRAVACYGVRVVGTDIEVEV